MEHVETLFSLIAFMVVGLAFIFIIDDLFIDVMAIIKGKHPLKMDLDSLDRVKNHPEKRIAIMVANWKEYDVIGAMIRGNIRGIQYSNYCFFIGVYPNDEQTWAEAVKVSNLYPDKVQVVVNSQPGPTSKGQLLNEIVRQIIASENETGTVHDLFLMQDSEDVLHPHSLSLLNYFSEQAEFTQIPVFSFDVPKLSLVSGVYIDEFSEAHTKDLLVRQAMGAAVPSAGVGTCLARDLVVSLMQAQDGGFLKEDTLTEDYHLGIMTKPLGYRSQFLCVELQGASGKKEFIATRECFPTNFHASIRQKARWTLGICYQGWKNIGWQGNLVDRYFLLRDRKGPLNSLLVVLSLFILLSIIVLKTSNTTLPEVLLNPVFEVLMALNLGNMLFRIFQRMRAVHRVNGFSQSLMVPVRWVLANIVNVAASYKAHTNYRRSVRTGERPQWVKTQHQLPAHFVQETSVEVSPS
jgi:hypothetical protein